jgi:HSP20 family protein
MATFRRDNREVTRRPATESGLDPFRIMDALLGGDVFSPFDGGPRGFVPSFEVRETKDSYVFKADVPGILEKDIDIQMTGNVLTMSGERKLENVQEGEKFFALERGYGSFSRSFALPDGVDVEHVSAEVKDGVLTVRVPKKPEVQPRRIIIGSSAPSDPAKA